MAYQFIREPLRNEEVDKLCHACETVEEEFLIWPLLDTRLRVSGLCSLTPQHILWQEKVLRISGKGAPHGKRTIKRKILK
ncbi:MAG: hypothetical protein EBT45_06915 [Alphaproteobacteria bacterium]|nr:hypothetical protein [Alphaproteobacteria bacterium]